MRSWLDRNKEFLWTLIVASALAISLVTEVRFTAAENKNEVKALQTSFQTHCENDHLKAKKIAVDITRLQGDVSYIKQDVKEIKSLLINGGRYGTNLGTHSSGRKSTVRDIRNSQGQ